MTMPGALIQLSGVVIDLIYRVDAVPAAGTEAHVSGFTLTPGGGFNAMVAARRAGLPVAYGGRLGTGPLAEIAARGLTSEGIETVGGRDATRDQGCCTVMVDAAGERTFLAGDGAEAHVSIGDLDALPLSRFGWALLSGYALHHAGARDAFHRLLAGTAPIPPLVFDPAPVAEVLPGALVRAALGRALWVSCNAREAVALTGHDDPSAAARELAAGRPAGGGAVVRLGAEGCVIAHDGRVRALEGHPVHAIDTNGAGDAHVGSFIAALARGDHPAAAARHANVAAALATTREGPATAPDRAAVEHAMGMIDAG